MILNAPIRFPFIQHFPLRVDHLKVCERGPRLAGFTGFSGLPVAQRLSSLRLLTTSGTFVSCCPHYFRICTDMRT